VIGWEIGGALVIAVFAVAWAMEAWNRNIDNVFEILSKLIAASIVVAVVSVGVGVYYLVS
jgi:hypothetical protein